MRKIFYALFAGCFLCGCVSGPTHYIMMVDSLSDKTAPLHKTYVLLPGNKDTSTGDLQFKEFAGYVRTALNSNGLSEASIPKSADMVIFLTYGIGDPERHQYFYSVPIWGQTGVASSQTTGSSYSFGSHRTYSSNTTHRPSYGITGSMPMSGTVTTFTRFLSLVAYDLKEFIKNREEIQLWKTSVVSAGLKGDLRTVLPVLVYGAKDYFGSDTGQKVRVEIPVDDKRVKEFFSSN